MKQEIDILIGDLKQRKASACRQLLSDYGPTVLRMVSRIVTRREDAEEVYQDVFMKALRGTLAISLSRLRSALGSVALPITSRSTF